jgi:multimeric flavodoxin WrbA
MLILIIDGYMKPDGNTAQLSWRAAEALRAANHQVETVLLKSLDIHDCLHCDKCQSNNVCDQKDGMTAVFARVRAADALIISSPIYFWNMSGISRVFIDRLYSLSGKLSGKKLGFITTSGGDPFDGMDLAVESLARTARYTGMEMASPLYRAPAGGWRDWDKAQLDKDVSAFVRNLSGDKK